MNAKKSPKTAPRVGKGLDSEKEMSLPRSLVATLPTATVVMHHIKLAAALLPQIEKELVAAKKSGAPTLARSFVVLQKMGERIAELLDVSDSGKVFSNVLAHYRQVEVPAALEQAGLDHVPLSEGYRVGVSQVFRASIMSDQKSAAYDWLRNNGLEALITQTVNASTLSAAAKKEVEERNREFPENLFKVAYVPTVSVTRTK